MRMIISSSDGRLYPRQKCSIHIKMVQKDMFPTAMPFFQHSFFVYLISFMQIKGHSKGARITHSRYSISRVRIPSATPVHEPDKILATHIAGFPFDDPRKLMSPWIVNVAALDGQRLLSRIEKEAVELWIPHDFQCGSVKRNPAAAKIERNSRLFISQYVFFSSPILSPSPKGALPVQRHASAVSAGMAIRMRCADGKGYRFGFTVFGFIMAASTRKMLIFRPISRRMSFII